MEFKGKIVKSIKSKIILLVIFSTVILSGLLGIVVFINVNSIINQNAVLSMSSMAQTQKLRLDAQLKSAEKSTLYMANKIKNIIPNAQLLKDANYKEKFTNEILTFALDIVRNSYGVTSVYMDLEPDFASKEKNGFFYAKQKYKKTFVKMPTDGISDPDLETSEWWLKPKNSLKPEWISPYYDDDLGTLVISHVSPIFDQNNTFIGIIGIDMDFSVFLDLSQNFWLYNNAVAHLVDVLKNEVYNNIDSSNNLITTKEHTDKAEMDIFAKNENNGDSLIEYKKDGKIHKLAFETLANGMKFVLHAPDDEIFEQSNKLLFIMYSIIIFVVIFSSIFAFWFSKRLIEPLLALNEATKQISQGNYNINIKNRPNDEVGELANSISSMADKIKDYMSQMSNLAYKDPLTGIRNKIAYKNYTKDLQAPFAVVVFGINNLKIINEKYEYSTGDALVIMASKYICKVFSHSAIFRLESDEFAAILRGEDFENRDEIIKLFSEKMSENELEIPPYSALSVAHGMAIYTGEKDFKEVYLEATTAMLENKRKMKEL